MVLKRHNITSRLTALLLAVTLIYSCSPVDLDFTAIPQPGRTEEETTVRVPVPDYRNVFIVYSMGFNNLSGYLQTNIKDLLRNPISDNPRDVVLIFSHLAKGANYSTLTSPTLTKVSQSLDGSIQKDTLMVMPETTIAASPEVLNEVLSYVHENFEAKRYGLLMSSHGTGWVPTEYLVNGEGSISGQAQARRQAMHPYRERLPLVKTIGAHYDAQKNSTEINITELAEAIPFKLDYLIFDACFMGGIEVAYELRNVTNKVIASQTEILGEGMHYPSLCSYLFACREPDLTSVCRKYYELYDYQSGIYRSATISLMDCSKMEALAQITKEIISRHRSGLARVQNNRNSVQKYFRKSYDTSQQWFYDFEDIITQCGPSEAELNTFKAAIDDVVLYKAATPYFWSRTDLTINHHSGLSMYLPVLEGRDLLNDFYRTLAWNKATGLVE